LLSLRKALEYLEETRFHYSGFLAAILVSTGYRPLYGKQI